MNNVSSSELCSCYQFIWDFILSLVELSAYFKEYMTDDDDDDDGGGDDGDDDDLYIGLQHPTVIITC